MPRPASKRRTPAACASSPWSRRTVERNCSRPTPSWEHWPTCRSRSMRPASLTFVNLAQWQYRNGMIQAHADDPTSGKETVLLVDDNAWIRALTSRTLRDAGYNVLDASNGEDAL